MKTKKESSDQISKRKNEFLKTNKSIRRQIRKAVVEQFSSENHEALEALIQTAKSGKKSDSEKIESFTNYANELIELSFLACFMSSNFEGNQMVQVIAKRLQYQIPHVIHTSKILCLHNTSKEALQNMEIIRDAWISDVKLLTLAIDDIISVNDFLLICENEILNYINNCLVHLQANKSTEFKQTVLQVIHRIQRVCNLVTSEMSNFESCAFTNKILETVETLRSKQTVLFNKCADYSSEAIEKEADKNENEFIEASRLIYYGVRDLRRAMIQIPTHNSQDVSLIEEETENLRHQSSENSSEEKATCENDNGDEFKDESTIVYNDDEDDAASDETLVPGTSREQAQEIQQQFISFHKEKSNFDREVLKWDDKSNDIIVLSKAMCVILMDMINFTRSRGPYKSIVDVISAAKRISEIGIQLEKLCRELASECPESPSKKELLSYLTNLVFFCNQISICVKVKENTIDVSDCK